MNHSISQTATYFFNSLLGDYEHATNDLNDAIKLYPQDDEAYRLRANAYFEQHNFENAIGNFSEGLKLAEARIKDNPAYIAQFYVGRAKAYNEEKRLQDAINDYSKALQLDPAPQTYVVRGTLYLNTGDANRAIADYNEAIRLDRQFALAWNDRCFAEAINDQLALALKDCNESLSLSPGSVFTLDSRGLVYLKIGDLDNSIADYDAALKVEPRFASSLYGRGLAKNRKESGSGDPDIAAAAAISPDIAKDYAGYRIK